MFVAFLTVAQKSNYAEKWGYNYGTESSTKKAFPILNAVTC
jgi:hypothetical protein